MAKFVIIVAQYLWLLRSHQHIFIMTATLSWDMKGILSRRAVDHCA